VNIQFVLYPSNLTLPTIEQERIMRTAKQHLNKPLISLTDGKKLGKVKDLYLDGEAGKIVAAFLGRRGIINRKTSVIARSSIQVMGIDAWLVSNSDRVEILEELPESETYLLLGDLLGREILTEGGHRVGTVGDVILDEVANVQGFNLDNVFVQGPLAERRIIARAAITHLGDKSTPMTTILEQAETLEVAIS
jgi:sporulation protein YlmC with PRC-barrel domain